MIPLHFRKFNDKVHAMNTGHTKDLKMTVAEARALHYNIFTMLEELNAYKSSSNDDLIEIEIDAGDNSL